jgi:maleate cis-trans isomerase
MPRTVNERPLRESVLMHSRSGQILPGTDPAPRSGRLAMLRALTPVRPVRSTFHSNRMWRKHPGREALAASGAGANRSAREPADAQLRVIGCEWERA